MKSLEERIADREARGKELAKQNSLDGKPSKEEIEAATSKTLTVPVEGDASKRAGGNKAPEWKPNA